MKHDLAVPIGLAIVGVALCVGVMTWLAVLQHQAQRVFPAGSIVDVAPPTAAPWLFRIGVGLVGIALLWALVRKRANSAGRKTVS